ncbi:hypothetical protein GPA27_24530 [Aromatoleum toluolicum]|uniref:4Fe-4S ferredoxin-type domain-containing protein n=1 Tax=Aromatoleum toluolicum TaxID=90060 RepID=A0ABX1NNE3_9RHOO|nr:hypothetical protein [Aromatoleum toluolicum]NMG00551.1 hypothetical protein [Aromatoleum toluolicum]
MSVSFAALDAVGLNLQAVFDLDALPAELATRLRAQVDDGEGFHQLILIGHAGRKLWESVQATGLQTANPIDDFSIARVEEWFATQCAGRRLRVIYPGDRLVDLQRLGELAGWHHPSPFMVGIQAGWGSWFAYRVAMLADSELPVTAPAVAPSPCNACTGRPCVAACPADAMASGRYSLERCIGYRRQPGSLCADTCLARTNCPVGSEHRYCDAQIEYHYALSRGAIERYL